MSGLFFVTEWFNPLKKNCMNKEHEPQSENKPKNIMIKAHREKKLQD